MVRYSEQYPAHARCLQQLRHPSRAGGGLLRNDDNRGGLTERVLFVDNKIEYTADSDGMYTMRGGGEVRRNDRYAIPTTNDRCTTARMLTAAGLHAQKGSALKGTPNAIATKTTDAIQQ